MQLANTVNQVIKLETEQQQPLRTRSPTIVFIGLDHASILTDTHSECYKKIHSPTTATIKMAII